MNPTPAKKKKKKVGGGSKWIFKWMNREINNVKKPNGVWRVVKVVHFFFVNNFFFLLIFVILRFAIVDIA